MHLPHNLFQAARLNQQHRLHTYRSAISLRPDGNLFRSYTGARDGPLRVLASSC
jgi:hypothetical protein